MRLYHKSSLMKSLVSTSTMKSHLFCAIFILISCPLASIRRERKLEVCGPFSTRVVTLSSNSTHFCCFSEINLKPRILFTVFRTPSKPSLAVESTVEGFVSTTTSRGSCHLTVRNNRLIRNSYRVDPAVCRL